MIDTICTLKQLKASEKVLLIYLYIHKNSQHTTDSLINDLALSRQTISRGVVHLKKLKLIWDGHYAVSDWSIKHFIDQL